MRKLRPSHNALLAASLVAMMAGCENKMYPISGIVKVDGVPFANGSVNFIPVGPGRPAYGGTDTNGRFTLDTGNTPGAPKGTYKLVLQRYETAAGSADERTPGEQRAPLKSSFTEKYAKPETSDITIEVPSPNGAYEFNITSK
jgi:hypothetical protein